jgi:hypothetical protein
MAEFIADQYKYHEARLMEAEHKRTRATRAIERLNLVGQMSFEIPGLEASILPIRCQGDGDPHCKEPEDLGA